MLYSESFCLSSFHYILAHCCCFCCLVGTALAPFARSKNPSLWYVCNDVRLAFVAVIVCGRLGWLLCGLSSRVLSWPCMRISIVIMKVRQNVFYRNWSNGQNALTLSPLDAAAPLLICWKVPWWRTATAAVSVAANKVVVELTNVSFANFIVLDMKKMQRMMK